MTDTQPDFLGGDYHKKGAPSLVDSTSPYRSFAVRGEQMQTPILVTVNQAVRTIRNLRNTDPERFVKIVEQLSVEAKPIADTLTGENHPLHKVMGRRRNDPSYVETLLENIREAREERRSKA